MVSLLGLISYLFVQFKVLEVWQTIFICLGIAILSSIIAVLYLLFEKEKKKLKEEKWKA